MQNLSQGEGGGEFWGMFPAPLPPHTPTSSKNILKKKKMVQFCRAFLWILALVLKVFKGMTLCIINFMSKKKTFFVCVSWAVMVGGGGNAQAP